VERMEARLDKIAAGAAAGQQHASSRKCSPI
jgi:hypothetical protein